MATALPGTGVPVSTDILTTLNGVAATTNEAIQRIKVSTGAPGTATDVSLTNTFPVGVIQPDVNVPGTITTTDIVVAAPAGNGVPVSGTSTAGSYVVAPITGGYTAWVAQVTGLTTGTLYFELSADSTNGIDGNWINVIGRQTGILNSTLTNSATVNGNWRGNLSSYKYMRLRSVGTLTGTPAILIRMSAGVATVFLNGSLPTGQNNIGAVNLAAAQTLATVTTVSAVTAITNALPVGANVIGALTANQSVNKAQINGVAPLMGNGVSGTGSQRVNIASDNTPFTVTANQGTANANAWLANPLTAQITAEASSAKTVSGNSASSIINPSYTGVMLFLNASVVSGTTPSLTVSVQVQDPVSAAWVNLPGASFPAVVAVTATPLLLVIDLGIVAVANAAVNMPIPRTWRLAWAISGTTPSFTFSVGAQYLI